MPTARVALVDCNPGDRELLRGLEPEFVIDEYCGVPDADRLVERAAEADALVTLLTYTQVTAAVLERLPRLRLVVTRTVGYSHIDVATATARGVAVANVPGASCQAVAEFVIAALLALFRHIYAAAQSVRNGEWRFLEFRGVEVAGRTLGVVGTGAIGCAVAELARALGLNVLAWSPHPRLEWAQRAGVSYMPLDDMLPRCDAVSINVALTPDTRLLFNRERLNAMRRGALLINTARGGLVDELALYDALVTGHLAGAALDVFAEEPPDRDLPLFQLPNVLLSPHIAWHTEQTVQRQFDGVVQNLKTFFSDRSCHVVNPEVLRRNGYGTL